MSYYCFAYPQTRHILGFNVINSAEPQRVCAINLHTLLSAGTPYLQHCQKTPKSTTPVHFVPLIMKSGNNAVACIQHKTTRNSRGDGALLLKVYLCQRLLIGILSLSLSLIGTRCVCVTLWEMAEMRDSEAARATINSWNG